MFEITTRTELPYSAVSYITVTFSDGFSSRGSGAVVGVNDVLTALHVVYQPLHGGWARSVSVIPGADTYPVLSAPFGSYSNVGTLDGRVATWDGNGDSLLSDAESQWDLALIGLASRIGDATGWLSLWTSAQDVSGTVAGYPARGTGLMADTAIAVASPVYGVYNVAASLGPGASGGPLLFTTDGRTSVAGVLSAGDAALTETSYAALFGPGTLDWLQAAMAANDRLLASAQTAITGTAGADTLSGTSANDSIDGGGGIDTVRFSGARASYSLAISPAAVTVTDTIAGRDGTDTLTHVERLRFSDIGLAVDLDGNAGTVAKVIGAVFGAPAVANTSYVAIGLGLLDGAMAEATLMQFALAARLGPNATDAAVINLLYGNVVGSAPSATQRAAFQQMLDSGFLSQVTLGVAAAESSLNAANVNLVGLAATGLAYAL